MSTKIETNAITAAHEMAALIQEHPTLGLGGWRTPSMSAERFAQEQEQLVRAVRELDLVRKVFRDPRFRRKHRGEQNSYRLKHVAEIWECGLIKDPPYHTPKYNGLYIGEGVATAAAILEEFRTRRVGPGIRSALIFVPSVRQHPVPRSPDNLSTSDI